MDDTPGNGELTMSKQLTVSLHFVYTRARALEVSPTKADVIEGDRVGFIFDPEGDIVWATVTSIAEGISGEIGILRFDPPPPCGREGRNGWETPDAWVSHATICEGDFVSAIDRSKDLPKGWEWLDTSGTPECLCGAKPVGGGNQVFFWNGKLTAKDAPPEVVDAVMARARRLSATKGQP